MPVEGSALTSGMLVKQMRKGDWRQSINTHLSQDFAEQAIPQAKAGRITRGTVARCQPFLRNGVQVDIQSYV
jgi:hypothetical protein